MSKKYVLQKQYETYEEYLKEIFIDYHWFVPLSIPIINILLLIPLSFMFPILYRFEKWKKVPLNKSDVK